MISVISVVSGPALRSRVRRHDHYGEWYGSEQDVLSLTLLTTLTAVADCGAFPVHLRIEP